MEEKEKMQELLERIDVSNRRQEKYALLQCIFAAVAALCCGAFFVMIYQVMPQVQQLMTQLQDMLVQMEGTMVNLDQITTELAQVDMESMVQNMDNLVTTGQSSIEETMNKLNRIDFDALNQAIENLANVVEPLAKFFNMFG